MRHALTLMSLMLIAGSAPAALTPGQQNAAEALIAQFTAKEFAVRQAAVTRLKEFPFKLENVPVP